MPNLSSVRNSRYQFHPVVWTLVVGMAFLRFGLYMSWPFLTLYLTQKVGLHPVMAGVVVGASSLAKMFGGLLGGALSDKIGRRMMLCASLGVLPLIFLGFGHFADIITQSIVLTLLFTALSFITGLCRSWYETLGQALIADLTTPEQKVTVFGLRNACVNAGIAAGPVVGAWMGVVGHTSAFYMTALVYSLCALGFAYLMYTQPIPQESIKGHKNFLFKEALGLILKDKPMLWFLMGTIIATLSYSQVDSTFGLLLKKHLEQGERVFAYLLSINSICILIFQYPVTRLFEKIAPLKGLMVSLSVFILSFLTMSHVSLLSKYAWVILQGLSVPLDGFLHSVGFTFQTSLEGFEKHCVFFVGIVFFSFAQTILFSLMGVVIDGFAPAHLRGLYFGTANLMWLGKAIGPALGGYFIHHMNDSIFGFSFIAFNAFGILFYVLSYKAFCLKQAQTKKKSKSTQSLVIH
jgi:MFS family permease